MAARHGRELPLPLLLMLAVCAVLGDRFRASRQKPLLVAVALLACVALGGFGIRLANRAAPPSPTPVAAAPADAPASPTAASPWPTATLPAVINAALSEPPAMAAPSAPPTATGAPTATANAPVPASAASATVPPTPRGTTVIPILMYHYVRVVADKTDTIGINLSVTPANFAAQMQYLADNGYTTLTMSEVHAILAGTMPLPPKPIALTFDDGYRDFYTAAWSVLKRHNFKATNYVVTGMIGMEPYMTWAMLQELDATGQVELGAHTRNHLDLRALNKDKRWDEIVGSKAILEQGLGHPVTSFCYPAGFYNADTIADVKRAGFLTAVTTAYGVKQNPQNPWEMPRVRVNGPDSVATWASKLP